MGEIYIREDVQALLASFGGASGPSMRELGPTKAREMVAQMTALDAPLGEVSVIRDVVCPGPAGGVIPLRLFDMREHRAPGPLLVYYHGGGFVVGNLDSHASFCAEIARRLDVPVVAVDYRLAPEAPWPAAPDDCEAAARWIASNPSQLGRAAASIVLAGDSAGGGLAAATAIALREKPAAAPVLLQWLIYPIIDLEIDRYEERYPSYSIFREGFFFDHSGMEWFHECYAPDPEDWRASPIKTQLGGLIPTFVLAAGVDPLRDQGRAYAAACAAAGVTTIFREAAGNLHGFCAMRSALPSGASDLDSSFKQLRTMLDER